MKNIKDLFKCYLPGFILGIISVSIITVYAKTFFPSNQTTYDNTNTELKSDNVQDAIDELYGVCFPSAGDQIIEEAGLEKDPYECRYFFTGTNPNNYITFNDEKAGWRIISVECDGTIKIMSNKSAGTNSWDTSNSNNWARPATLNTYLNNTYYNIVLNNTAQNQIVVKNWSIGAVAENNNLGNQINDESSNNWEGKIGLPTISEYLRTNSNTNCKIFITYNNYNTCKNTTWMFNGDYFWTISGVLNSTGNVYKLMDDGSFGITAAGVNGNYEGYRPTLYLSSSIKITGGTGTQTDPYTIE